MRTTLALALLALAQPGERRELLVVYGGLEASEVLAGARNLAGNRFEPIALLEAASVTREDLARGPLALVGTPASNRWLEELAAALPLPLKELDDPGDSIAMRSTNPLNHGAPLFVATGSSEDAVRDALGKRRRADVHVRRNGKTVMLKSLDPEAVRRFDLATKPALSTARFDYFPHGGMDVALPTLAAENERLLDRIAQQLPLRDARLEIHLYSSLEEKGLVTDDTRVAHFEGDALHAVAGIDRTPERLLAQRLLDVPENQGLATVVVHDDPDGLDALDRTARRLLETSHPPSLSSLEDESPYVVEALSASFARFVLAARGAAAFASADHDALEPAWLEDLRRKPLSTPPLPAPPGAFQRGFTFAHEGFNIDNGYLSARGERSLDRLAALGVDAVAIVPYSFMRAPDAIGPLPVPERPGSETDEDVTHAIRAAKARGMTVLLKPQIWIRGSWPGEIAPASEADEGRFFQEYGRWIRHYALMAEQHGVELLSVGTELSKMTRGKKKDWETLIADVRRLYRGKLVYAANWGAEVEQVDFWPLLDYIGVDFYYPLSQESAPTDDQLRSAFEKALDSIQSVARRYQKPVLLTEIGYASTKSPWKSPHASDRSREVSPEDQARAYRIAFEALADETDWIRGTYWWKWPTDLARGGENDKGFTPSGKAAEDVVGDWYRNRLH